MLLLAFQNENHTIYYDAMLHVEHEEIEGKSLEVGPLLTLHSKDEDQNLATFFNILHYDYISDEALLGFNFEARYNTTLFHEEYVTPVYLNSYGLSDINTGFISMFSADINTEYLSLSLGRNKVNMPWLQGSIDSVLLYHENELFSLRGFWFANYYDFQVNYFSKFEDINEKKGIYGAYFQSEQWFDILDVSLYYYFQYNKRDISGAELHVGDRLKLNFSYTYSKDYRNILDTLDESYIRLWGEFDYAYNHFEVGGSITGENALTSMLQLGSHPFSEFYLNNEINRARAKNMYLKYGYENEYFYIDILGGMTQYYDDRFDGRRIVKDYLNSSEYDIYVGSMFTDSIGLELSYMKKDVDDADLFGFDQSLVMATLLVSWQ